MSAQRPLSVEGLARQPIWQASHRAGWVQGPGRQRSVEVAPHRLANGKEEADMPAPSGQLPPPWAWWENEAPITRAACSSPQAGLPRDARTRRGGSPPLSWSMTRRLLWPAPFETASTSERVAAPEASSFPGAATWAHALEARPTGRWPTLEWRKGAVASGCGPGAPGHRHTKDRQRRRFRYATGASMAPQHWPDH